MTLSTHARRPRTHVTGAASTSVRPVLESPRRRARVLAAFSAGIYLEVRTDLEPSVIAIITGEATRLPNSVLLAADLPQVAVGDDASVGEGTIELGRLSVRARRWWDPAPPLPELDSVRLAALLTHPALLENTSAGNGPAWFGGGAGPGLAGHGAVELLAEACARGWLLGAVSAAEQLVGLGPGLTPSGDDVLAGLLVALRHLGAVAGVERAVWLADWLAATVTYDARTRTTPISATLLHCAARGESCPEVTGVLRALTGRQPLDPALARLCRLGHTSGADLAQGIAIGLASVQSLATGHHAPAHLSGVR